ncbi:hypothetical protein BC828DRAFT_407563 [Blastocladiella britannica]|nr:hypothetical protein BC828DRAFT_407563 [Blastocladiella britannica]
MTSADDDLSKAKELVQRASKALLAETDDLENLAKAIRNHGDTFLAAREKWARLVPIWERKRKALATASSKYSRLSGVTLGSDDLDEATERMGEFKELIEPVLAVESGATPASAAAAAADTAEDSRGQLEHGKAEADRLIAAAKVVAERVIATAKLDASRLVAGAESNNNNLGPLLEAAERRFAHVEQERSAAIQRATDAETKLQVATKSAIKMEQERDAAVERANKLDLQLKKAQIDAYVLKNNLEAAQDELAAMRKVEHERRTAKWAAIKQPGWVPRSSAVVPVAPWAAAPRPALAPVVSSSPAASSASAASNLSATSSESDMFEPDNHTDVSSVTTETPQADFAFVPALPKKDPNEIRTENVIANFNKKGWTVRTIKDKGRTFMSVTDLGMHLALGIMHPTRQAGRHACKYAKDASGSWVTGVLQTPNRTVYMVLEAYEKYVHCHFSSREEIPDWK